MLKTKYEEKAKMGALAEKKNCFNSAVSLYYYNIYLRLKHYLNIKQIEVDVTNKSSHVEVIETFINNFETNELSYTELCNLYSIPCLLKNRKKADYDEKIVFNERKYKDQFKHYYEEIDNLLKKRGI